MSSDALVVTTEYPELRTVTDFAAAADLTTSGDWSGGLVLQNADGEPLLLLDPALRVEAAEVDAALNPDRRQRYGGWWWLELHAPAAAGEAGTTLLDQLARLIALTHGGEVGEPDAVRHEPQHKQ